ncbi:MFS transporter [Falsirhodobacter sp. 1013]|uniref:MFS transporter n=1 Tax=Falsirhodobacter sp. 1013 TaxID=3417566 RepID=UPI003EBADBC6
MHGQIAPPISGPPVVARWPAVYAVSFGVFGLIAAEFLPMSLLTPMATDLQVSEGMAGQAVTATAVVALFTGLLIATLTRGIDRRHVLLGFSVLLILSNLLVALSGSFALLLVGRLLLGVAIGGFWTMSAAIAMRLVPSDQVPKALSMIFAGVSLATVVAAPLGSWLGAILGWREVYLGAALFGALGLLAQWATLPAMASTSAASLRTLFAVLLRPGVWQGITCVALVFTGHFALFTFIRPFLEVSLAAGVTAVTVFLLGFGVANFVGTLLAGPLLKRSLGFTLMAMPLLAGASALALSGLNSASPLSLLLVSLWGLAFGAVPVAWTTWNTRVAPDEPESAGGLIVAAIQFAIAAGAGTGGLVFESAGSSGVYTYGGAVLVLASALIALSVKAPNRVPA